MSGQNEEFQLTLELVEKISGPSRTAREHVERLKASAEKAGKTLDYGDKAKKAAENLARIKLDPHGFIAAREATKKLAEEQRKLIRQHEGFFGGLKSSLTSPFSRLTGAVAVGEVIGEGIKSGGEFLVESAKEVVSLLKEGITKAFEVGGKEEHLRNSFKYVFGGGEQAKAALEEAERFSKSLPFGGTKTAGYLGELGTAGIKGQAAASSLALAADVGAMSPSGEGTDEALAALERLKRHGEFSNRLAEGLNINLPDLYASLGKQLNVSAAEAQKKLGEPGKVGFNTILNTLMEVHSRAIGAPTGSVALEQSKELMQRWERIKELPEEYLRSIASAPGWSRLSETLGRVLDQLDPNKHPEIVKALIDSFDTLAEKAREVLTPENVKKFTDAIANLPSTVHSVASALDTVLKVSEAIAAVWAGSKLVALGEIAARVLPVAGTVAGTVTRAAPAALGGGAAGAAALPLAGLGATALHDKLLDIPLKQATDDLVADLAAGRKRARPTFSTPWINSVFGGTRYDTVSDPAEQARAAAEYRAGTSGASARTGTPSVPAGGVTINVPKIEVNVTPAKDDVNHTGQQVGVAVHREATQAFERAAQEAGAT